MLNNVVIDGKTYQYENGTTFESIAKDFTKQYGDEIALVLDNGKMKELYKSLKGDTQLQFVTRRDRSGHKTYVRTAIMLFIKAARDVIGTDVVKRLKVECLIGPGYYITKEGDFEITDELVEKISARMQEMVDADLPFMKRSYKIGDAVKLMEDENMIDKVKLFRYRRDSNLNLYCLDGYYDYFYGYMLPSTGYIKYFRIEKVDDGFILILPRTAEPDVLPEFEPLEKLFHTMRTSTEWGKQVGIEDVGDLNDAICSQGISDILLLQEAEQERRIADIAKTIKSHDHVKFILIAGPSSSGKTSFANRLCIQLKSLGKIPHLISMDNYFVNREDTPRDEKGDYNFECLEALDVKQFNKDMNSLLAGETVEIPFFNFQIGRREYHGDFQTLGPEDVLVMEGIHGLNPKLTASIPNDAKFKIYISALTCLNVDDHNYISTTDNRLIRRIVRDARTRGASAKRTIQMWPSVRRGEEQNIFPYQEEADVMFNSAQLYELSLLKQYAEPLLFNIHEGEPEYYEAKRLLKFLNYFLGMDSSAMPNNSICREFVGGSIFKV